MSRGVLSGPAIGDRLEEVGYRLDGHVAHLLLDEFQDTSAPQWQVLRPWPGGSSPVAATRSSAWAT